MVMIRIAIVAIKTAIPPIVVPPPVAVRSPPRVVIRIVVPGAGIIGIIPRIIPRVAPAQIDGYRIVRIVEHAQAALVGIIIINNDVGFVRFRFYINGIGVGIDIHDILAGFGKRIGRRGRLDGCSDLCFRS
jgi:hypothetical protein